MLARVVGKGRVREMPADELRALQAPAARTMVDVGTGDGRLVYAVASAHPDWLVIGIDALEEPMGEIAHKAARKPSRGGRANVVLLRASVEALPPELEAVADAVSVMLPWGRLLEGIVLPDDEVLRGIATLCRPGARVDVTLNGEIWEDSTPVKFRHLPPPTPEYVAEVVAPAFGRVGIDLEPARWLHAAEAKGLRSTWARRLADGREHPRFLHVAATAASC